MLEVAWYGLSLDGARSRRPHHQEAPPQIPPHAFFLISAVFHYLGPAFAVLLFTRVDVLGVAWLRIAAAALVFATWRRPWRLWRTLSGSHRRDMLALGATLALMNASFYLAIDRIPLSTVAAIEFAGPIALAALGARSPRNVAALAIASAGVWLLTDIRLAGEPLGLAFAFANGLLFLAYVVLGHRVARDDDGSGLDCLGAAMLVALVVASPLGLRDALAASHSPTLILAGIGVGVCSSVIPYVCDQLAMARLPRSTFALLLALLPASATVVGLLVLGQRPQLVEVVAVALVIVAVALHRSPENGR